MYMPILETFDHPLSKDQLSGTPLNHIAEAEKKLGGTPEAILTCGPEVMTAAVAVAAAQAGAKGCASLEAHMACGVGACMGCVVQTTKGYRRVCKEGPVFKLDELVFDQRT